jgi:hypothetical protein
VFNVVLIASLRLARSGREATRYMDRVLTGPKIADLQQRNDNREEREGNNVRTKPNNKLKRIE